MRQYKVGDKVTIRSWESMEREFGLSEHGNINIPPYFTTKMKEYCGKQSTILSVLRDKRYELVDFGWQRYIHQMFTDWETDNANEKKMQCNWQDVELITEGYWPEGVTLICSDDGENWRIHQEIVCISNCAAFYRHGDCGGKWKHWALLPAKPAPRRLTNREALSLCKIGYDCLYDGDVAHSFIYPLVDEDKPACDWCQRLRAPNTDEWLEPTSDLLERAV